MESGQYRVVRYCTQFGRLAPFICDADQLIARDRNNRSVTGMEVHLHFTVYHFEVFQIGSFRKLIFAFHVYIIH